MINGRPRVSSASHRLKECGDQGFAATKRRGLGPCATERRLLNNLNALADPYSAGNADKASQDNDPLSAIDKDSRELARFRDSNTRS